MLKLSDINMSFENEASGESNHILKDLNMEVSTGDIVAIVGRSGSGKSTLLSLISGIQLPSEGQIYFDDTGIHSLSLDERTSLRGKGIGTIFQDFKLIDHLTVLENTMLPMQLKNMDDCEKRARDVLRMVELGHRENAFPDTLSGGEKQRVAIARAMGMEAKLILADEPNANLDIETGKHVMDCLFDLCRKMNQTMILVTHDAELSHQCDKVYKLTQGHLELS